MKAKLIKSEDSYILKDGLFHVLGIDDKKLKDRLNCPYLLSKKNCEEMFGVTDVEKLAIEYDLYEKFNFVGQTRAYKAGFNKAMELNDKVFTLEDMLKAIQFGEDNTDIESFDDIPGEDKLQFIQSLQQPTEIEVEIEMEYKGRIKLEKYHELKPKLDSEGCLILKKI
jgi:hypothetical protein